LASAILLTGAVNVSFYVDDAIAKILPTGARSTTNAHVFSAGHLACPFELLFEYLGSAVGCPEVSLFPRFAGEARIRGTLALFPDSLESSGR
jgi:hypothetical protein